MTHQPGDGDNNRQTISRRGFIRLTGVAIAGAGAGIGFVGCGDSTGDTSLISLPVSQGYLVVDTAKCQGCVTCMLACSLVHEGVASLSASRIQIIQNSFDGWPNDVFISQCRQCEYPECVMACPRRALYVDTEHGNVRRIDRSKCIGCGKCVKACPYLPKKPLLSKDQEYGGNLKSRKCDLCADAPYLTNARGEPVAGGPGGMQACVAVCPVGAIEFRQTMPDQNSNNGYYVNLRDEAWEDLGYPSDTLQEVDSE